MSDRRDDHRDRLIDLLLRLELGSQEMPDVLDGVLAAARRQPRRTSRPVLRWASMSVAAAALLALWVGVRGEDEGALRAAVVGIDEGAVRVGEGGESPLRVGDRVAPGETVRTASDGTATLRYPDGTTLALASRTALALEPHARAKRLRLAAGELRASVAEQPAGAPLAIDTPRLTATVVGTRFALSVGDGEAVRLDVDEGRVRVQAASGDGPELAIGADEFAQAATDGTLVKQTRAQRHPHPAVLAEEIVAAVPPGGDMRTPTVAQAADGTLVAAWGATRSEATVARGVWIARRSDDGWSPPRQVDDGLLATGERQPCWAPVLFQPRVRPDAPLLLYYRIGPDPSSWQGAVRTSSDGGRTWSGRRWLPASDDPHLRGYGRFIGPTKNRPLELPDGSLLIGSSVEYDRFDWRIHLERTGDHVADFALQTQGLPPATAAFIQPAFLVHSPDRRRLQMIVRSFFNGRAYTSFSTDTGRTWSPATPVDPPIFSAIDALTLDDGRHLLVGNGEPERRSIVVLIGPDGRSWRRALAFGSAADPGPDSERDYPSLAQDAGGSVHLVFTHLHRQAIKHVVIDPSRLTPGR